MTGLRSPVLLASLLVLHAAGCGGDPAPRTEVVAVIDAEPNVRSMAKSLRVVVTAGNGGSEFPDTVLDQVIGSSSEPVTFPVRVALVPRGGDSSRTYRVEAQALDGSTPLAVTRAISGYLPRRTLSLAMVLENACLGIACTDVTRTCASGTCQTIAPTDPSTLPTYVPPGSADAGGDSSMPSDGGSDGSVGPGPIAFGHYVKPSTPYGNARFGRSVAISGDTMVVGVPYESSDVDGINPMGRSGQGSDESGAVYVFRFDGTTWNEEAYIKPSANKDPYDHFGYAVAIDGDVLVVGAPDEDSALFGVHATPSNDNAALDSGAAYVFRRSGNTWSQEAYLKAANTGAGDAFGFSVAVSGSRIVVGAFHEASSYRGVWLPGGPTLDDTLTDAGAAYVYAYDGSSWSLEAMLKSSNSDGGDIFGGSVDIDGDTIVVGASGEDSTNTSVTNGLPVPADNSWANAGAAFVFDADANPAIRWRQSARLKSQHLSTQDFFAERVAISGDLIACATVGEDWVGQGVDPTPTLGAETDTGAVYTFVRSSGTWSRDHYLKPPTSTTWDRFGDWLGLDGNVLVVGVPYEDGTGRGIDAACDATDEATSGADAAGDVGAAFVFQRGATTWTLAAYLKAPNADLGDHFGIACGVSGTRLVVTADREASNSSGVDGNQADNSGNWNGAAYTYVVP